MSSGLHEDTGISSFQFSIHSYLTHWQTGCWWGSLPLEFVKLIGEISEWMIRVEDTGIAFVEVVPATDRHCP